jgi:hypothetical protein
LVAKTLYLVQAQLQETQASLAMPIDLVTLSQLGEKEAKMEGK